MLIMADLIRKNLDVNTPDSSRLEAGDEYNQEAQEQQIQSGEVIAPNGSEQPFEAGQESSADNDSMLESPEVPTFVPDPEAALNESPEQIEGETAQLLTGENKIDPEDSDSARRLLEGILNSDSKN